MSDYVSFQKAQEIRNIVVYYEDFFNFLPRHVLDHMRVEIENIANYTENNGVEKAITMSNDELRDNRQEGATFEARDYHELGLMAPKIVAKIETYQRVLSILKRE